MDEQVYLEIETFKHIERDGVPADVDVGIEKLERGFDERYRIREQFERV